MKKLFALSVALALTLLLSVPSQGGWFGPTGKKVTWYGKFTHASDTAFYPDGTHLLDFTEYNWWGYELEILVPDTTLPDSVGITIFTGHDNTGWTSDSLDSMVYSVIEDHTAGTKGNLWYSLHDTATGAVFLGGGVTIRINISCLDTTDTSTVGGTDPWGAAGDSIRDWNTTNGGWESEIDEAIGATDLADFIYVKGKDSLQVLCTDNPFNADVYNFDSIMIGIIVAESLDVIAMDTIRMGIGYGDTIKHHFDSLTVVWGVQQALTAEDGAANGLDTLIWSFVTDPRGNVWQKANLDSLLVVFDPVHVDSTSAGAAGALVVYHLWLFYEANRDTLNPPLEYRLTQWLKQ